MTKEQNAKLNADDDGNVQVSKPKDEKKQGQDASVGEKRTAGRQEEQQSDVPAKSAKINDGADVIKELKSGSKEQEGEDSVYKVLEQGLIYFFYRPKVQADSGSDSENKAASSIDDVQNTHMLLVPVQSESSTASIKDARPAQNQEESKLSATTGEEAKRLGIGYRLVRLGKKRLPAPEEAIKQGQEPGGIGGDASEAIWACISDIGQNVEQLTGQMGERRYSTKTRGQRIVGATRPVARGRYTIILHDTQPPSQKSVRLAYVISHPSDMGDVQKELGLLSRGNVRMSMRNPTTSQQSATGGGGSGPPVGLPQEERIEMSRKELDEEFGGEADGGGGTRYTNPENIDFLDREGVELLLTRERHQQSENNDDAMGKKQADALDAKTSKERSSLTAPDILDELALSANENPPNALEQGVWV